MKIERDENFDVLIVVPTVAHPGVLGETMERLAKYTDGLRVRMVVSINSESDEHARICKNTVDSLPAPDGCVFEWVDAGKPVGFGPACNFGLNYALLSGGVPPITVFHNDDAHVTEGWLKSMVEAVTTKNVKLWGDPPGPDGTKRDRDVALYGKIGIVGPTTTIVAGIQKTVLTQEEKSLGLDGYAALHRETYKDSVITCDFLSGFCMAVRDDCLEELMLYDGDDRVGIFDPVYEIAGYEDNDLCFRAWQKGWRMAVAAEVYIGHVGHQTFDRLFPEHRRGMRNRLTYYKKWESYTQRTDQKLMSVWRVKLDVPNDLAMWRGAIMRAAQLTDGISVVLTGNPLDVTQTHEWTVHGKNLPEEDLQMLRDCNGASPKGVARAVREWIEAVMRQTSNCRAMPVTVRTWEGDWNERDERNESIGMAEFLGADWIISIDHDEVIEDRISRDHIERWMTHPDPLVQEYNFSWLNHWDSSRLCREDTPWGDGGRYVGGMNGQRMWRACKAAPRRIIAGTEIGLHCGNVPDADITVKRVAGMRFRHFGYLRASDRVRKYKRYNVLDPNPDPMLTGNANGYGHLISEEGMRITPYAPINGVGLYMLCYAGEDADDIARWLDNLYSFADQIVLVWTEPNDGPKPSPKLQKLAELYNVVWVHHPLNDDLAAARNAGLDALQGLRGVGWALFFDPDEWISPDFQSVVAMRRMAETTDSYGWLFKVNNLHADGSASYSESVRMSRLDETGLMRMNGRVHEGFDKARIRLQERGIHPMFKYAPFDLYHNGLALTNDKMAEKFKRYQKLLVKELHDAPHSTGAWVALGLMFGNDGQTEKAKECYERGVACSNGSYLPFQELGMHHLRVAKALLMQVIEFTTPGHPRHKITLNMLNVLEKMAPDQLILGREVTDPPILPNIELPEFELPDYMMDLFFPVDSDNTGAAGDSTIVE